MLLHFKHTRLKCRWIKIIVYGSKLLYNNNFDPYLVIILEICFGKEGKAYYIDGYASEEKYLRSFQVLGYYYILNLYNNFYPYLVIILEICFVKEGKAYYVGGYSSEEIYLGTWIIGITRI